MGWNYAKGHSRYTSKPFGLRRADRGNRDWRQESRWESEGGEMGDLVVQQTVIVWGDQYELTVRRL